MTTAKSQKLLWAKQFARLCVVSDSSICNMGELVKLVTTAKALIVEASPEAADAISAARKYCKAKCKGTVRWIVDTPIFKPEKRPETFIIPVLED